MNNPYYNGLVEQYIQISISSDNHDTTLNVRKRFKKLCDAFSPDVSFSESKSARKGDVFERTIHINHTDYPSNILAVQEAIMCLVSICSIRYCSVVVYHNSVFPKDYRLNIISQ